MHPIPFLVTRKKNKDMACNQVLNGLARDCQPSMGGIVEALAINKEYIEEITATEGKVTAITLGDEKFKAFYFARNTGSMTSTYTLDPATGVRYVTTDLVLQFNRMETAKRIEITALAQNELVLIVKDANGKYWLLGKDEPVMATAGEGVTGTARSDRNGYSITLQDTSLEMPYEVEADIVAALIG